VGRLSSAARRIRWYGRRAGVSHGGIRGIDDDAANVG